MNRPPQPHDPWFAEHQRQCGGTYIKISEPIKMEQKRNTKREPDNKTKEIADFFIAQPAINKKEKKVLEKNSNVIYRCPACQHEELSIHELKEHACVCVPSLIEEKTETNFPDKKKGMDWPLSSRASSSIIAGSPKRSSVVIIIDDDDQKKTLKFEKQQNSSCNIAFKLPNGHRHVQLFDLLTPTSILYSVARRLANMTFIELRQVSEDGVSSHKTRSLVESSQTLLDEGFTALPTVIYVRMHST